MVTRKTVMLVLGALLYFSGCGYGLYFVHVDPEEGSETRITKSDIPKESGELNAQHYYNTHSQNPVILTHADIEKKKVYIQKADEALKHFYLVACDTRKRGNISSLNELGREANRYVKIYVEPILNDAGAIENMETRAEVAKLYLVTASLYYELAGYYQAKYYLTELTERFGKAFLLGITTDNKESGYSTVAEGIEYLERRISLKQTADT